MPPSCCKYRQPQPTASNMHDTIFEGSTYILGQTVRPGRPKVCGKPLHTLSCETAGPIMRLAANAQFRDHPKVDWNGEQVVGSQWLADDLCFLALTTKISHANVAFFRFVLCIAENGNHIKPTPAVVVPASPLVHQVAGIPRTPTACFRPIRDFFIVPTAAYDPLTTHHANSTARASSSLCEPLDQTLTRICKAW